MTDKWSAIWLASSLCFSALITTPAEAYKGKVVSTCGGRVERERTVDGLTAHVLQELPCVWRDNIRESLDRSIENAQALNFGRIQINASQSDCEFQPRFEWKKGVPTITIGAGFIKHWMFAEQAQLLLILDEVDIPTIVNYFKKTFAEALLSNREKCRLNRKDFTIPTIYHGLVRTGKYDSIMRRLQQDPAALALEREVVLSTLFILLHEAGHYALGHAPSNKISKSATREQELSADDFATYIFEHEKLSTTLSMGGIITLSFTAAIMSDKSINHAVCRVRRVLRQDHIFIQRLTNIGISRRRARRIARNYQAFVETFSLGCVAN